MTFTISPSFVSYTRPGVYTNQHQPPASTFRDACSCSPHRRRLGRWSILLCLLLLGGMHGTPAQANESSDESSATTSGTDRPLQEITVAFAGEFGGQPFDCAARFDGIGATDATVTVADYRLYVSRLRLLDATGEETPAALVDDGRWQTDSVALLDFEDATGHCRNGTPQTNTTIRAQVPEGEYTGIAFDIGVPFEHNHGDPTLAASPLNLTGMFWNWRGGYRFLRVDLAGVHKGSSKQQHTANAEQDSDMKASMASKDSAGQHGAHGSGSPDRDHTAMASDTGDTGGHSGGQENRHGGGHGGGWALHVGSTGCNAPTPTTAPQACAEPNRIEIVLDEFDTPNDTIVVDAARVLSGVDVSTNTPETAPGCMSAVDDPECMPVLDALGLSEETMRQALIRSR